MGVYTPPELAGGSGGGGGGGAITAPLGAQSVAASVATVVQGEAAAGSAVAGNPVLVAGSDGVNARLLAVEQPNADAVAVSTYALASIAQTYALNGATWDRLRTPAIFKTVTATASGNTTLWTPTLGKKFRLMRFIVMVTANASLASAGIEEITFQDSATGLPISFSVAVPSAAGTSGGNLLTTGWVDLGNGILSAAANNVLNLNLATALATGECRVTCCGTEE